MKIRFVDTNFGRAGGHQCRYDFAGMGAVVGSRVCFLRKMSESVDLQVSHSSIR